MMAWETLVPWGALGRLHKAQYTLRMRRGREFSNHQVYLRQLYVAAQDIVTELEGKVGDVGNR